MDGYYIVRVDYSGHASKNELWKVLSRPMSRLTALSWLDYQRSLHPNHDIRMIHLSSDMEKPITREEFISICCHATH